MSTMRWVSAVVGVIMLLMGTVFALQGAYGIGGGSSMDNNPVWIYIGGALAVIGFIIVVAGTQSRTSSQ